MIYVTYVCIMAYHDSCLCVCGLLRTAAAGAAANPAMNTAMCVHGTAVRCIQSIHYTINLNILCCVVSHVHAVYGFMCVLYMCVYQLPEESLSSYSAHRIFMAYIHVPAPMFLVVVDRVPGGS